MGGKYSIIARNLNDLAWQYDWYGNSVIKFIYAKSASIGGKAKKYAC